ncbi:hypothetical protein ACWGJ2_39465 [Streptomyces sp. NPDC054796]
MSAAFAMPAAVRLPRTAVARRALLTVFFLGGFLALAFLFGGSAHADSGPRQDGAAGAGSSSGLLEPGAGALQKAGNEAGAEAGSEESDKAEAQADAARAEFDQQRAEAREEAGRTTDAVVEPVAESAENGAEHTGGVTRPVGEKTVETVQGVAHTVGLDELTDRLGHGQRPGHGDGSEGRPSDGHGQDAAHGERDDKGADGPHGPRHHASSPPSFDPAHSGHVAQHAAAAAHGADDNGGVPADRLPLRHLPATPAPTSSTSSQSFGDGNGSRGGADQLAAYVSDMERYGLPQPGAVRAAHTSPTRDRAGDILEFPG